ncbi:DUF2155 domain-containing protein [Methyloceanibacter methanicus]|uniref:DUF2155 domain-containing protein n=1 Tax=Methyloceanibacter methanicus TaxID=1774968 RepID=UPI000849E96A|nr:DUF2155 domain-containing protein [Methyloceanibacter methanicus]
MAALATCGLFLADTSVCAAQIKNEVAVFAALDKVTGRIQHLEIPINQTVAFGALKVTPRICNSRPLTEKPDTASFVEVDEVKLTGEQQRIFTGLDVCREARGFTPSSIPCSTSGSQAARTRSADSLPRVPRPRGPRPRRKPRRQSLPHRLPPHGRLRRHRQPAGLRRLRPQGPRSRSSPGCGARLRRSA